MGTRDRPGEPAPRVHAVPTFQPTFLYESLYCLALGLVLIWVDHHFKLKKFQLFALYCMGYTAARFVFEEMRIDPAHTIGPLRVNAWVSIVVFLAALVAYVWLGRHGQPVERARTGRRRARRNFSVWYEAGVRVGCTPAVRGPRSNRPGETTL